MGWSSQSGARAIQKDQWVTRSQTVPGGPGASDGRTDLPRRDDPPRRPMEHEPSPRHLFDDSDHLDADSQQRRTSRERSTTPALTLSASQGEDTSATPWCLHSLVIRGGRAQDGHVSLSTDGSQGSSSDVVEVGRTVPESPRERSVALDSAGTSGLAPESAECRGSASELAGAKRSAPKQGSLDQPVKRVHVRSSM
jgi:hypothetical protein